MEDENKVQLISSVKFHGVNLIEKQRTSYFKVTKLSLQRKTIICRSTFQCYKSGTKF